MKRLKFFYELKLYFFIFSYLAVHFTHINKEYRLETDFIQNNSDIYTVYFKDGKFHSDRKRNIKQKKSQFEIDFSVGENKIETFEKFDLNKFGYKTILISRTIISQKISQFIFDYNANVLYFGKLKNNFIPFEKKKLITNENLPNTFLESLDLLRNDSIGLDDELEVFFLDVSKILKTGEIMTFSVTSMYILANFDNKYKTYQIKDWISKVGIFASPYMVIFNGNVFNDEIKISTQLTSFFIKFPIEYKFKRNSYRSRMNLTNKNEDEKDFSQFKEYLKEFMESNFYKDLKSNLNIMVVENMDDWDHYSLKRLKYIATMERTYCIKNNDISKVKLIN